ncbi:acyl-CoA dehydrogenase family protein [Saccharopolyspora sp. WRP15-2]|uniref:Acyl-CoA dehydrogenase family protein n=1 Tax=Saccharopolyspora oryzae TaxID=2997343 RepID=A0ABT4UQJ9_9PSEU|nr:acyl-CoA dehydrogenase family protein [Saccharopolyspora oryzae]MDA3624000.1 acyl-CoA dehydrogenase family protein [Saccharopolyspora oryzae]
MSIALTRTAEQQALAESVRSYCAAHCTEEVRGPGPFPWSFWQGLAELGVLSLAMPGEDGGAGEIAAVGAELGRAAAPGPVAATVLATHTLPPEQAEQLGNGTSLVSFGQPPLMPWAPLAEVFVEADGEEAWLARPVGEIEPVEVLGGDPWGRVALERVQPLERVSAGMALADIALAAYLWGAGRRLLDAAAEHARTRVQFGRPIGSFQAVAHPIVTAGVALTSAEKLTTMAALAIDDEHQDGGVLAVSARLSASRAAVEAALVAHQTFGAIGYSEEGPIGQVANRIRQLANAPGHPQGSGGQVLARYFRKGRG